MSYWNSKPRKAMKRSPMRRVPLQDDERDVADWKKTVIASLQRPHENKGTDQWRIAGKPWPWSHLTEAVFQRNVQEEAEVHGWKTSHAHLPYFDTAGIPDLTFVHPEKHRIFMAELKVRDEKGVVVWPSPDQWRWLTWIALAGVRTYVWVWPDSWSEIEEVLAA